MINICFFLCAAPGTSHQFSSPGDLEIWRFILNPIHRLWSSSNLEIGRSGDLEIQIDSHPQALEPKWAVTESCFFVHSTLRKTQTPYHISALSLSGPQPATAYFFYGGWGGRILLPYASHTFSILLDVPKLRPFRQGGSFLPALFFCWFAIFPRAPCGIQKKIWFSGKMVAPWHFLLTLFQLRKYNPPKAGFVKIV